ncbi:hypothetical protein KDL29_02705 [bacterium]|nr:hypothetical protein [bacterium]
MPRVLLLVLLLPALCALLSAPLAAQDSIRIETRPSATPNGKPAVALVINGETVVRLTKNQRNRTPLRNLSLASVQLSSAYRRGRTSLNIEEDDTAERQWKLMLDGELLLLATDMEGKAWGADPEELCLSWMNNINLALGVDAPPQQPMVQPANSTPVMPATEGPAGGGIAARPQGSRAEGASDNAGLIKSGGHRVFDPPAPGSVASGHQGAPDRVVVTGDTAALPVIREGIDNLIRNRHQLPPDSRILWNTDGLRVAPGREKQLKLDWISSQPGGGGGSKGSEQLTVENRRLHLPRENLTWFSNRPERVSRAQLLYFSKLKGQQAGRLVFHHQNQSGSDLDLVCRLLNTGGSAASVHVIPGLAEPDVNTFYVGYRSAENYWTNLNAGNGYVLEIPAGGQAFIVNQRMRHGMTASGYMTLSSLDGGELRLEVMSVNHGSPVPPWALESKGEASYCVFGEPFVNADINYSTGDNWLYMRLGSQLPASLSDSSVLQGCYGMTHSYNVELKNLHNYPALVFVVLRASAGEVKGQFFIDDEYVGTSLVASGEEQLLKDIPLRPGETKLLRIRAIPLNGGFYPASIIIREQRYP